MLTGVTGIEFLPPATGRLDLVDRIKNLFSGALRVRASIAFWTLSPSQLESITDGNAYMVLKEEKI